MFILVKNLFLVISYLCLLGYMFIHSITITYLDRLILVYICYYSILLIPRIHQIYVYNIVERIIPKWTYLIRALFHYVLFYPTLTKAFPAVLSVFILMWWKDIYFLITHAEKRLAKIEMSMFDEECPQRIAHLHLNVFADDMGNRFHKHCFNTNRIYLIENTQQSSDSLLSIHNYRSLRMEGKPPRAFTGDDKLYYKASNNKRIFISHREYFILTPLLILVWLMAMTDVTASKNMYINHGILLADVLSKWFGNKINDFIIGIVYLSGTVAILIG